MRRIKDIAGFAASPLTAVTAALTAVEGTWGTGIHSHWGFAALVVILLLCLAAGILARKGLGATLSHAGLFLVLAGGLAGGVFAKEGTIRLYEGQAGRVAMDSDGFAVNLPFDLSLQDFETEFHLDGTSPKQYASTLSIDGEVLRTSVNHPAIHKGWRLYQSGFGEDSFGEYSVLKVARNPFLTLLALGALLLAAGAALSLTKGWKGWKVMAAGLILAAGFTAISVARINFGTLPPALRSLWFVPHLAAYMLAYAALALSVVTAFAGPRCRRIPDGLSRRVLFSASSLLLIGMICGAVWAQRAWGSYWTWDPKECWAAATWLLTLAAAHLSPARRRAAVAFIILSFLAMNVTWYGVDFLPSAALSLHTYR